MRDQAVLSLLRVSRAWSCKKLIFHNLLNTAISIYSEMQIGVEGTGGRGRNRACHPPWPGGDGEKTQGAWLAINPLEPIWNFQAFPGRSPADLLT